MKNKKHWENIKYWSSSRRDCWNKAYFEKDEKFKLLKTEDMYFNNEINHGNIFRIEIVNFYSNLFKLISGKYAENLFQFMIFIHLST